MTSRPTVPAPSTATRSGARVIGGWLVTAASSGRMVARADSARSDGSAVAIGTVRDGGRLATITQDPPDEQRGIEISSVIVEPDGRALGELAELVATGKLEVSIAATFPLEEAAEALGAAIGGGAGGAVVLRP